MYNIFRNVITLSRAKELTDIEKAIFSGEFLKLSSTFESYEHKTISVNNKNLNSMSSHVETICGMKNGINHYVVENGVKRFDIIKSTDGGLFIDYADMKIIIHTNRKDYLKNPLIMEFLETLKTKHNLLFKLLEENGNALFPNMFDEKVVLNTKMQSNIKEIKSIVGEDIEIPFDDETSQKLLKVISDTVLFMEAENGTKISYYDVYKFMFLLLEYKNDLISDNADSETLCENMVIVKNDLIASIKTLLTLTEKYMGESNEH